MQPVNVRLAVDREDNRTLIGMGFVERNEPSMT
jgi:hypothetical protein